MFEVLPFFLAFTFLFTKTLKHFLEYSNFQSSEVQIHAERKSQGSKVYLGKLESAVDADKFVFQITFLKSCLSSTIRVS